MCPVNGTLIGLFVQFTGQITGIFVPLPGQISRCRDTCPISGTRVPFTGHVSRERETWKILHTDDFHLAVCKNLSSNSQRMPRVEIIHHYDTPP
jgi:hypothetical protein